eukprot:7247044-Heterocapsa_arctica.AAC.1
MIFRPHKKDLTFTRQSQREVPVTAPRDVVYMYIPSSDDQLGCRRLVAGGLVAPTRRREAPSCTTLDAP